MCSLKFLRLKYKEPLKTKAWQKKFKNNLMRCENNSHLQT